MCDRFSSQNTTTPTLEDILNADGWARQEVLKASEQLNQDPKIVAIR